MKMVYLYCPHCEEVTEQNIVGNKGKAELPFVPKTIITKCTECTKQVFFDVRESRESRKRMKKEEREEVEKKVSLDEVHPEPKRLTDVDF